MLSDSETTCWLLAEPFLLPAEKILQGFARKLRALALTCVQDYT